MLTNNTFNTEFKSKNFEERKGQAVQFLVLHYTAVPLATTLGIFTNNAELAKIDANFFAGMRTDRTISEMLLCEKEVSAHYLNSEAGEVYQLVDEEFAARHAGASYWNGVKDINGHSIGIEHENIGYDWLAKFPQDRGLKIEGSEKTWCKFTEPQIKKTIELCREIIKRYGIKPYNVIGHSDIACGRKSDPGPLFPWKQLMEAGVGIWYDMTESTLKTMPENAIRWMQEKLSEFGYNCPVTGEKDDITCSTIKSFQMHFRQNNIDGNIDLECIKILDSLCQRKQTFELAAALENACNNTKKLADEKKTLPLENMEPQSTCLGFRPQQNNITNNKASINTNTDNLHLENSEPESASSLGFQLQKDTVNNLFF